MVSRDSGSWFNPWVEVMLLITFIFLVNAIIYRRRLNTQHRVALFVLLYSGIICYDVTYLDTGIGILRGLFHPATYSNPQLGGFGDAYTQDLLNCLEPCLIMPLHASGAEGLTGADDAHKTQTLEENEGRKPGEGGEQKQLDPYFITGFSDAEGTFVVSIYECPRLKTG